VVRSVSVTAKTYARLINKTTVVPDTTLMPKMTVSRLSSLYPTHVLY